MAHGTQNLYADQINLIRARGGDVIVSFGGEAGSEIAIAETNAGRWRQSISPSLTATN